MKDFFADQDREQGGPRRAMAKALTLEQQAAKEQQAEIQPIVDAVLRALNISVVGLLLKKDGGSIAGEVDRDYIRDIVREIIPSAPASGTYVLQSVDGALSWIETGTC